MSGYRIYDRSANFGALPYRAGIPADDPEDGWSEYLAVLDPTIPTFNIGQGPNGFTMAADYTRALIEYLHSWPQCFSRRTGCYRR